jgi:uncharacterized membrane protein YphA (DoxX/SURF4 family)
MKELLDRLDRWAVDHADVFFDLIRIYLGVGLFFKAIYFMQNRDYLMQLMDEAGPSLWVAPALIGHYVMVAHFAGGIFLALGLLTRLAALIQVPVLLGAVLWVHLPRAVAVEPRQNLEFSLLVLVLLLIVTVLGSGRLSLDQILFRKEGRHPTSAKAAA